MMKNTSNESTAPRDDPVMRSTAKKMKGPMIAENFSNTEKKP